MSLTRLTSARVLFAAIACASLALAAAAEPAPVKILLVGDSTMVDPAGWAPGFRLAWGPEVQCFNRSQSGRSSKSYRTEGWWTKALAIPADYVLIEFGGNDVPGKGPLRETDPGTTYRENLERYVDEARSRGLKPVLVTSMAHRIFDDSGKLKSDNVEPYADAMRAVGQKKGVPVVDFYALTRALCNRLGPEDSERLGRFIPDAQGTIRPDVHLSREGAIQLGGMIAQELVRLQPELGGYRAPPWPAAGDEADRSWAAVAHARRALTAHVRWFAPGQGPDLPDVRAMAAARMSNAGVVEWPVSGDKAADNAELARIRTEIQNVHFYGMKICVALIGDLFSGNDREREAKAAIRSAARDVQADEIQFDLGAAARAAEYYAYAKTQNHRVEVGFAGSREAMIAQLTSTDSSPAPLAGHCDFVVFRSSPGDTGQTRIRSHQLASAWKITSVESGLPEDDRAAAIDVAFNYQKPVVALGSLPGPLLEDGDHAFTPLSEFYRYHDQRYFTNTAPAAEMAQANSASGPVAVEALRRDFSHETIVHLVRLDPRAARAPCQVTVRKSYPSAIKKILCLSPDRRDAVPVEFRESGGLASFTVPDLGRYALVVIAQEGAPSRPAPLGQ